MTPDPTGLEMDSTTITEMLKIISDFELFEAGKLPANWYEIDTMEKYARAKLHYNVVLYIARQSRVQGILPNPIT